MTIEVAIRTGSAVVFAADSKLTTSGPLGRDENGQPVFVEQTYDNATKLVQDRSNRLMAMVAGHANIGHRTATDFIATWSMKGAVLQDSSPDSVEAIVKTLVNEMMKEKVSFWGTAPEAKGVPPEQWPGPVLLISTPDHDKKVPRVWRADLGGNASRVEEILKEPRIYLEGSYRDAFTLLYGYDLELLESVRKNLAVEEKLFTSAVRNRSVLSPIDRLNLWSIPLQDAIDLAVFLATVQVEMDRFLPGPPACGGPIDVMILQMVPQAEITVLPGKVLHHPKGTS